MTQRTIEYILSLKSKSQSLKNVKKDIKSLLDETQKLEAAMRDATDPDEVKRLNTQLDKMNDELLDAVINADKLDDKFEDLRKKTSESAAKMEELGGKLSMVGGTMLGIGTAAVAPLILLANKYVDVYGETEETGKRLVGMSKEWEEIQLRIGRVAAEQLIPLMEKGLVFAEKVAKFVEDNPGVIKAAIGIGGTLIALGGALATAGKLVQAVGAIQKISAIAGVPLGGGAGGIGGALGGLGASLTTSLTGALTAAAPVIVPILALAIGAEIGRLLVSAVAGEEYTWKQIGQDFKNLIVMSAEGWDVLFNWLGIETNISGILANAMNTSDLYLIEKLDAQGKANTGVVIQWIKNAISSISNAFTNLGRFISTSLMTIMTNIGTMFRLAFTNLITAITGLPAKIGSAFTTAISTLISKIPKKAEGGNIGSGLFIGGEDGREFVMSNRTTRAAERIVGGRLTQDRLLDALSGRSMTYNDNRRFTSPISNADRRRMIQETVNVLNGVFA